MPAPTLVRYLLSLVAASCVLAVVPALRAATLGASADELLVQPHTAARRAAHAELTAAGAVTEAEIPGLGVQLVRTAPGAATRTARRLRASRAFRYVEPNYRVRLDAVPDDALYPQQWGPALVHAPQAWDTTRGSGIVIAVLDTGVDATHPDLAGNLLPGFNVLAGTPDTTDDNGHGTHMAGIAAAVGFNGIGVTGMAPDAMLMPVKVLDASGSGSYADVAQGIVYAADHGARVINLSLGGEVDSGTLSAAVTYAQSKGVVIAAAAGNDASSIPTYPAAYPGVIAVGATDAQDVVASFSNSGPWLTLVAPGVDILTTDIGGGYADSTGTSPATPFAAGAAALLLAAYPQLDPHLVGAILALTSTDLGAAGFDSTYGWGRLDVGAALDQATALAASVVTSPPAIDVSAPPDATTVQGVVPLQVSAENSAPIARVEYSLDGTIVAAASDAPFTAAWNAASVSAGPHVLSATAYDVSGQRASAAPVTVVIAGAQPTCTSPGATCLAGGGPVRTDCFAQWLITATGGAAQIGPGNSVTCTDGAACDADGKADGVCTFSVGLCFSTSGTMSAAGRPLCQARDLQGLRLLAPAPEPGQNTLDAANAAALVNAVAALGAARGSGSCIAGLLAHPCSQDTDCDSAPAAQDGRCGLQAAPLTAVAGEQCTAVQTIRVPLTPTRSGLRPGTRRLKTATTSAAATTQPPLTDTDWLRLRCLPPA